MTCNDCRHFQIDNYPGAQMGRCRRYAPRPQQYSSVGWPYVQTSDYCGEWQSIPDGAATAEEPGAPAARETAEERK